MPDQNSHPANSSARRLLDLESGNRRGLEKAMQHLLGRKSSPSEPVSPAPATSAEAALKFLLPLGFEIVSASNPACPVLSHPLAEDRSVPLELRVEGANNIEGAALDFALVHFPELEFYLPFITTRARYLATLKKGKPTQLEPEPDYDEDGFLH